MDSPSGFSQDDMHKDECESPKAISSPQPFFPGIRSPSSIQPVQKPAKPPRHGRTASLKYKNRSKELLSARSSPPITISQIDPTPIAPILYKSKSLKVTSSSPSFRPRVQTRPRSHSQSGDPPQIDNPQSKASSCNVESLQYHHHHIHHHHHHHSQLQLTDSKVNKDFVASSSINSKMLPKNSELRSTSNDTQKKERGTDIVGTKKGSEDQKLKLIISQPSTKGPHLTDSDRLLASIESTKKLPVEDLCRHLSPYQHLVISSRSSFSRSTCSPNSRSGPPPMPIKEYKVFFTSTITQIPYFETLLEDVNLNLAWEKMPNEAQKTLWDYIRNCFTMVRLLFDLESIEIPSNSNNENSQKQKTLHLSKSIDQPNMLLAISDTEKVVRGRGRSFHDESPRSVPADRVKFINTLSTNSLKWHICSFEQSQQTFLFPLIHLAFRKKTNDIDNSVVLGKPLDIESQTLICVVLHRNGDSTTKKSMIGFLHQGKVRYCEYLSQFQKATRDTTLPNFLSIEVQLRERDKQTRYHQLHFYCSQHAKDVKFLLELHAKGFSGFKEGQICLHKGHVEFVTNDGSPVQCYLRLFKSRLLLYTNGTQPLPKTVIPLTPDTLKENVWSDGLPGIEIENKLNGRSLKCTIRLDTQQERDKWFQALTAEVIFKESLQHLVDPEKTIKDIKGQTQKQKPGGSRKTRKKNQQVSWTEVLNEGKEKPKIQNIRSRVGRNRSLIKKLRGPDGVVVKEHQSRRKRYSRCFKGSELVTWLVEHRISVSREAAIKLGENLRLCGMFDHVTEEHLFRDDHVYYQFTEDVLQRLKEEAMNTVATPDKLKEEARKLIKVYFGSDNPSLGLNSLKFWYAQLWKNAKEDESILIGLLLLQQEGSQENLALYCNINQEKVQLTICFVVNTLLRRNAKELLQELKKILKENSHSLSDDDKPKITGKSNKNSGIPVVIWYRFPWLLDKGYNRKTKLMVKPGSNIQLVLHQALSYGKKKKWSDEITSDQCAITPVGSYSPIPKTDIIDNYGDSHYEFWLIYLPKHGKSDRPSAIKTHQALVQLITLDMEPSSFFSFLLDFRRFDIMSQTDIPCLSNWLKITKSNFLRSRPKAMKSLDQALEVYTEYTRVGREILRNCRLTCTELQVQSVSSQIGFAFPGFDSQIFHVGQHACICPWQILCGTDTLSYTGSEFSSGNSAKELMQASPDVSQLFETDINQAKQVMHEAQLVVLHNIYLSSYLRQHIKYFGKDGLSSNDIIPWSTVKSQFQGEHNRSHLESWAHLSYIYNPSITKFFTMFRSTLVLKIPQIAYGDDDSEQGQSIHISSSKKNNNLDENMRLLVQPLKFLLILRLIMESRYNALEGLLKEVKLWMGGVKKIKDLTHDPVKTLEQKIKNDQSKFNVLLDTIPAIQSLNAAYNARRKMNTREDLEKFLQNRPTRERLETNGIIPPLSSSDK